MIYLINIFGCPPGQTTESVVRVTSARRFATGATDSLPHTKWLGGVKSAYYLSQEVLGGRGGGSRMGNGEVSLFNPGGRFDYLRSWALAGHRIEVLAAAPGSVYAAFAPRLTGIIEKAVFDRDTVTLKLRDYQYLLDKPLPLPKFSGTNSGADGTEGGDDLKGKLKPVAVGYCPNITPVCVNQDAEIFQAHFRSVEDFPVAKSNGSPLSKMPGTWDYPDPVTLKNAVIPDLCYATCLAHGMVRPRTTLGMNFTCDVKGDNVGGYVENAPDVAKRLLSIAEWPTGNIHAASFAAMAAECPDAVGIYDDSGRKGRELLDDVCASGWLWYVPDSLGVLRLGRVKIPAGPPVMDIPESRQLEFTLVESDLAGPPWPLVTMKFDRNWTVLSGTSVAGTTPADLRAWLAEEYRMAHYPVDGTFDPDVAARFPNAEAEVFEGLYSTRAASEAEALRRWLYRLNVSGTWQLRIVEKFAQGLLHGDVVRVFSSRYGLGAGKLMWVSGIKHVSEEGYMELTLNG